MDRKEGLTIQNQKSKIKSHDLYRRPKFLTVLHQIRETMSREADYDVDLFAEMVRSGTRPEYGPERNIRGFKKRAPRNDEISVAAPRLVGAPRVKERKRAAR
ncbi:MAG TPA: hypothetical protein VK582_05095 [Pyrinomonadaceae bacterium]|nr:hypothetical protein [Pyrinomonadaceae bacterium]